MKSKLLALFFSLSFVTICFSQREITWTDLSKVKFIEKYYPKYDAPFLVPKFSASIKALEGKQITIRGYFLDIDPKGNIYILSKGPMSLCFFCGAGGPETIIELQFAKKKRFFKTDDIVSVTGIFKLNDTDIEHCNYILTECEAVLARSKD